MQTASRAALFFFFLAISLLSTSCAVTEVGVKQAIDLPCIAESSQWQGTGRHADVLEFIEELQSRSPVLRVTSMGYSTEGRCLPLLILADPPVASPEEARASGKLVVYAQGGIHAGECCGKEALQMLARELALTPKHPLLSNLIILLAPIYNPDGNERMAKNNRPGQAGPALGMGQRANGQGYDLNRDNTKLDSPEAQALAQMMTDWDPYLVIDTHTTNGSFHRNTLTFDGPVNPAGDQAIIDFVRNTYLPTVSRSLADETGYKTTFYGNYNRNKTRWTTYDGRPRFGTRARGIRGIISILTEAYKYASYKDRVLCTKEFCRHLLTYASEHEGDIRRLIEEVRQRAVSLGERPAQENVVSIRARVARIPKDLVLDGWVEKVPVGADPKRTRPKPTAEEATYTMEHWGAYQSDLDVLRPVAYVYPTDMVGLTSKLRQHGIMAEILPTGSLVNLEIYRIKKLTQAKRIYQGHRQVTVEVEPRQKEYRTTRPMALVRTSHHLGNLIVYLLEPQADDGLTSWGHFDGILKEASDFPVWRVMSPF